MHSSRAVLDVAEKAGRFDGTTMPTVEDFLRWSPARQQAALDQMTTEDIIYLRKSEEKYEEYRAAKAVYEAHERFRKGKK
jgi:hypothetical protein